MRRDRLWEVAALGALSGVRSLVTPAVVVGRHAKRATSIRVLAKRALGDRAFEKSRRLSPLLSALAAGELLIDKLPFAPPRTQPFSLAARAASGALVGSMSARQGTSKPALALIGAAAAVASAFASLYFRKLAIARSAALGIAAALAEDALVLGVGDRLARSAANSTT